ncbi:Hsp20/alpha crystallin family protein [Halothiobacillus sp.]|uniref:Hsp20/alpha crystallin family protein n=1 Tax=Halothiobacillus sp. TaxID=1891311 RepID=UPI0026341558|nr:Hsp20/alpha crystallin family protein [Halothiobacillus sp.]
MSIVRYEPFGLLSQLQRELARSSEGSTATAEWSPSVDIKEEPDRFVIHADVPGVQPQDIDVHMENGQLTIKGEKKTEATAEDKNYKRIERTYGSFYRRFGLPDSAEAEKISARTKHGVLEIVIPKRESVQPRKISVVSED